MMAPENRILSPSLAPTPTLEIPGAPEHSLFNTLDQLLENTPNTGSLTDSDAKVVGLGPRQQLSQQPYQQPSSITERRATQIDPTTQSTAFNPETLQKMESQRTNLKEETTDLQLNQQQYYENIYSKLLQNLSWNTDLHYDDDSHYNDFDFIEFLVHTKNVSVNDGFPGYSDETLLERACLNGNEDIVRFLLASGANPSRDHYKYRNLKPAHVAAASGHMNIVQILFDQRIENGTCHEEVCTDYGKICNGTVWPEYAKSAINISNHTPLELVAKHLETNTVSYLMHRGAELRRYSLRNVDILCCACNSGDTQLARAVLQAGVVIDRAGHEGLFPIHYASRESRTEIITLLRDHGAEVNIKDHKGIPGFYQGLFPIHYASREGHEEAVQLLCDHGAEINVESQRGKFYPIHLASWYGHSKIIRLLHERGAEVNVICHLWFEKKYLNWTPLHMAVAKDHLEAVETLLCLGANKYYEDNHGQTPVNLADELGNKKIIQALENCCQEPPPQQLSLFEQASQFFRGG